MSKTSIKQKVVVKQFSNKHGLYCHLGSLSLQIKLLIDYFDLKDYCAFQSVNKSCSKLSLYPYPYKVYSTNFHSLHPNFGHYLKYVTHLHEIDSTFLEPIKLSNSKSKFKFISSLPNLKSINLNGQSGTWIQKLISIKKLKEVKVYSFCSNDYDFYGGSGDSTYGTNFITYLPIFANKLYLSAFPNNININEMYSNLKILKVSLVNLKQLTQILSLPLLEDLKILDYKDENNPTYNYAIDKIFWPELPCPPKLKTLDLDVQLYVGDFIYWFMKNYQIKDLTVSSIKPEKKNITETNEMLTNPIFLKSLKGRVIRTKSTNIYFDHEPKNIDDGKIEKYDYECCFYLGSKKCDDYYKGKLQYTLDPNYNFEDAYNNYETELQKILTPNVTKLCFHRKLDNVYHHINKISIHGDLLDGWNPEDFNRQFPNLILLRIVWNPDLQGILKLNGYELLKIYNFVLEMLKLNSRLYVKLKYQLAKLISRFPLLYGSRIYY
jgi:hypothetical protein